MQEAIGNRSTVGVTRSRVEWPGAPSDQRTGGLEGLIGESAPMQAVFDEIPRLGWSEDPVHIFGETGTGKERVARALHNASRRAGRAFVAVNVATLGEEVLESLLFGSVRGAFTGAVTDRGGFVQAADGGTLFLDEVADLSPRGQAALLRFLQDGEYYAVGDNKLRRANVRVVSASNVSMAKRVAEGRLRPDLVYRLTALILELPPLRDRADDVVLLAQHALATVARRDGRGLPRLSAAAEASLMSHPWPGNVRELENVMARLAVYCPGRGIEAADIARALGQPPPERGELSLFEARRRFERDYCQRALAACGGHRTRTAARLGITRQALALAMRRHGLS